MENAALLVAIIENAIDGIITIDERGRIESINPAACKLFEYIPEEVIGKNVSMLMPPPDKEQHDEYLHRYQQTSKRIKKKWFDISFPFRNKPGSVFRTNNIYRFYT